MASALKDGGSSARTTAALLVGAAALSAAIRTVIALRTSLIGADGPKFLDQARLFLEGRGREAIAIDYHPGYPALVAGAARLFGLDGSPGNLERAGTIVSVVLGSLVTFPIVLLARRLAEGIAVASIAGLLYAINPYIARHGADIMSEATYLAFFAGALAASVEGAERRRLGLLLLSGTLAGLAYLTRPEGIGAAGLGGLYVLFCARRAEPRAGPPREAAWRAMGGLAVALPFLALALPYMLAIGGGTLKFTQKKSLEAFVSIADDLEDAPEPAAAPAAGAPAETHRVDPGALADIAALANPFATAYHPVGLAFFFLGVVLRGRPRARRIEALLLGTLALYAAVLARGHDEWGYVSKRHVFPIVVTTLPIAAIGLLEAADRMAPLFRGVRLALGGRLAKAARRPDIEAAIFLSVVAAAVQLPKTLAAYRDRQLGELRAGRFIREDAARRGIACPIVMTHRDKVAYYAGGKWSKPGDGPAAAMLEAALRGAERPHYVAIRARDEREPGAEKRWPGIEDALAGPPFVLVREERDGKGRFLVYFVPPALAAAAASPAGPPPSPPP